MLTETLSAAASGSIFGAALSLSGVANPSVIVDQMRLRDFHMLEVFLVAGVSSAFVMIALERLGVAKRAVRSNSSLGWFSAYDGNIVGGLLQGLGMSLSGACPGTVLVQLVHGLPSSKYTALGAVVGATCEVNFGHLLKRSAHQSEARAKTIAASTHIDQRTAFWVVEGLLVAVACVSAVFLPGKSLAVVPTIIGGLLIGVAQTCTILLMKRPLGVSTAYAQFGQYLWQIKRDGVKTGPPQSIVFALGITGGSLMAAQSMQHVFGASAAPAFFGGCALGFGARMASGCTSGHGLSGLAAQSFSSLVTVASMFGGGIVARSVIDSFA